MSEEDTTTTQCNCGKICSQCNGLKSDKLSITNRSFWDLWAQKILRNVASVKYQWLTILYIPVVWGMFDGQWVKLADGTVQWVSKIGVTAGLSFLGGGFITLATSRIIARTKLTEPTNGNFDTDK